MEFIINEWYLDWHRPDASQEEQGKARIFLKWLQNSENRIVLLRNSPFTQKLNNYRSQYNYHPMSQIYLKMFFTQIFQNFNNCRIIETPPELPIEIEAILARPTEPPFTNIESDRYLFQSAETTNEKIIVTTDTKLIKHFENNGRFHLIHVEDFISQYNI